MYSSYQHFAFISPKSSGSTDGRTVRQTYTLFYLYWYICRTEEQCQLINYRQNINIWTIDDLLNSLICTFSQNQRKAHSSLHLAVSGLVKQESEKCMNYPIDQVVLIGALLLEQCDLVYCWTIWIFLRGAIYNVIQYDVKEIK